MKTFYKNFYRLARTDYTLAVHFMKHDSSDTARIAALAAIRSYEYRISHVYKTNNIKG